LVSAFEYLDFTHHITFKFETGKRRFTAAVVVAKRWVLAAEGTQMRNFLGRLGSRFMENA